MAEFKFSCPKCGQRIECDSGYSGVQITCPACQQAMVVPSLPRSAAAPAASPAAPAESAEKALVPPPPPGGSPGLATRLSTGVPAAGRRFAGAPGAQPAGKPRSNTLRNALVGVTVAVVCGAIGFIAVSYFFKHQARARAAKGNPAAQVQAPTVVATAQAINILDKVHSAYTNLTSVTADSTVTLFLDLSNITVADVTPNPPANAKNLNRHPMGMPRILTNSTTVSLKQVKSNMYYYFAGEALTVADRQTSTNTFAVWSSDKGTFTFNDSHRRGVPATYMQLPDANKANNDQVQRMQHIFDDPTQLAKIIKDLGQTEDEPVNGQECYTLTAKVIGQKVKIWVDKTTYLIPQWQITLGGAISDADIDDVFSFVADSFTNIPPAQLEFAKPQVKLFAPVATKIRGVITATTQNVAANPTLSADDFNYAVPAGVRMVRAPGVGTATARPAPPQAR